MCDTNPETSIESAIACAICGDETEFDICEQCLTNQMSAMHGKRMCVACDTIGPVDCESGECRPCHEHSTKESNEALEEYERSH